MSEKSFSVFKFGGASLHDAQAIQNAVSIIRDEGAPHQVVVVSAIGKSTNALEAYIHAREEADIPGSERVLTELKTLHQNIAQDLGIWDQVQEQLQTIWQGVRAVPDAWEYGARYDATVCAGELASSTLLVAALDAAAMGASWVDARELIVTNEVHRRATVNWEATTTKVQSAITSGLYVTQGFIARSEGGNDTTLGREGSDYTAAILAHALNASDLTIWKDVPGVMTGDPRVFEWAELLREIPYHVAIELAFYGASVIHPKTIQPVMRTGTAIHVRSFLDASSPGTVIHDCEELVPNLPCWIQKRDQVLIQIGTHDLSFLQEAQLANVYQSFANAGVMINLAHHGAVQSSFCATDDRIQMPHVLESLDGQYALDFEKDLLLFTVHQPDEDAHMWLADQGEVLLEQHYGEVSQILIRPY